MLFITAHWVACAYCLLADLEEQSPTWTDIAYNADPGSEMAVEEGNTFQLYAMSFLPAGLDHAHRLVLAKRAALRCLSQYQKTPDGTLIACFLLPAGLR